MMITMIMLKVMNDDDNEMSNVWGDVKRSPTNARHDRANCNAGCYGFIDNEVYTSHIHDPNMF